MRVTAFSGFLLTALTYVTALDRRQTQTIPAYGPIGAPPVKPVGVAPGKPRISPDTERTIARWGPFVIPAMKNVNGTKASPVRRTIRPSTRDANGPQDPNGFVISQNIREGICRNCTVLGGRVSLVFEDIKYAAETSIDDGIFLVYAQVIDVAKQQLVPDFAPYCPYNGSLASITPAQSFHPVKSIFISGNFENFTVDYTSHTNDQFRSGYQIGTSENATYALTGEIVNYKSVPQTVYLDLDYVYVEGKVGVDAASTLLSATGCDFGQGGTNYISDEPKNTLISKPFPILTDGRIINARGHLNPGGVVVNLYLNDKLVCASYAQYNPVPDFVIKNGGGKNWETISGIGECNKTIAVKRGDYLKVESVYDTILHPLRQSGGEELDQQGFFTFTFVAGL